MFARIFKYIFTNNNCTLCCDLTGTEKTDKTIKVVINEHLPIPYKYFKVIINWRKAKIYSIIVLSLYNDCV